MTNAGPGKAPSEAHRRLRRRRFWLSFSVLLLVVAVTGVQYMRARLAELPELRTVKLERRDLRITIRATGTIEPEEIIEVGAVVSGKIIEIGRDGADGDKSIDVGSRVKQGDVLVQLDHELLQVEVQKAHAAWRLAEAEVGRLETQLKQSTRELQRAERLRTTNSQSEFDKVESVHEAAVADMAIGRARLEQAIAAAKQAEINLARATIHAPIDGVVIDRRANLGQNVAAGASGLFLLARSLDTMRIRTSVNETDIGKISVGQPVAFTVDSHRDRTLTGRVEKILMNAKLQGNFVTYDVFVAIDGSTSMLMPHMTADVEFETDKREKAWLVPTSSLGWQPDREQIDESTEISELNAMRDDESELPKQGDEAIVWVPTHDGRVQPLAVRVGIDDGVSTEVIGENLQEELPVVVGVVKKTVLARIIPSVKTFR